MTTGCEGWLVRESARVFEDLWIWSQARLLANQVYTHFDDQSPAARDYVFRDQVRRAAISVMNNIAEGFERHTDAEFARFLDIAKGSAGEVRSMYFLAEDRRYLDATEAAQSRDAIKQLAAGIYALATRLRAS